jgi:PAS domain S-box-containing protein
MKTALSDIAFDVFPRESVVLFLGVVTALATIAVLWKYRQSAEVRYLIFIEIFAGIWSLMYGMEFTSDQLEVKVFWSQLSYFGIAFLPVSYFLFTTSFSQNSRVITPLSIVLLSIIPFMTLISVLTNDYHHFVWNELSISSTHNMLIYRYGMFFWIFWVHSLLMIFGGLFNLFRSIYEFTAYYKSQVATLLVATVVPLAGNIMYVTGWNPVPGFDWTPVLFIFTGLVITFGIVRYRMFDLVPFARNKLIDTMSDGVIVVNADGFIEDFNPAVEDIFKLKNISIIRKRFSEVFQRYQTLIKAIEKEEAKRTEVELDLPGKQSYYQARISPVFNRNQQFSGHLVQVSDITSLKQTEFRLKKEVEKRGRLIEDLDAFAHTVAHDLRNSLGSVYSASEVIHEAITEGHTDVLVEFSELIKESAQKAIHITQELLILATVNHQEIEKGPLEMAQIFFRAKGQLKDLIAGRQVHISEPDGWPVAVGYANWVEEIWTNYLTNAVKYGGTPPEISVGAEPAITGMVRFWIKDNGNGILPENQHKLFKKYTRLSPEKAEGYGLGLSIVKRIIEKLDGTAGVESSGEEGKGSLFWFELPAK